jgi:hypothetical protein
MVEYIKKEPVVVLALVEAALVTAVAFGLQISVEQKVAIAGLTAAVLTVVTRQMVSPVAKLAKWHCSRSSACFSLGLKRWWSMREYLLLLCLCLAGCAAVKPYARTVNEAARILCETAFGIDEEAAKRGLSVKELCAMHDVVKPFLDEALKAQRAGAQRAGVSHKWGDSAARRTGTTSATSR